MKKLFFLIIIILPFFCFSQSNVIIRGPYLQETGPTSTLICWKTSLPSPSKIVYGTSKHSISFVSFIHSLDTNHCVSLPNLIPNTKYYYIVNLSNNQMNTDTFFFYTAPLFGSKQKIRFLALGDCGSGYIQQYNVKSAINYYNKNNYINGILLLGDNAYNSGFNTEYQTGFFNPYNTNFILSNSCIYPAPGNHEYANDYSLTVSHQIPYYEIFKTPQNAELGGLPSYHKEFYSFNYANVHFISLDSYGIEQGMYHLWDSLGPQYQWLEQDLQQDKSTWKIVFFHHPPYTMGSHNSDTEADLIVIRKKIASLLEKYGVDLVINGHSHNYERSWLQKGHFDLEATFNKTLHTMDSSSARYDGSINSCPYKKDTSDNVGTVYVVAGESGKIGTTQSSFPHNSKCVSSFQKAGALFIDIEANRLDAFYLQEDSLIYDKFTIFKNVDKHEYIKAYENELMVLSASWNGTYHWNFNGSNIKTQTILIPGSFEYIVSDSLNCLADTFSIGNVGIHNLNDIYELNIFPNPVKDNLDIVYQNFTKDVRYTIIDTNGKVIICSNTLFIDGKASINLQPYHLLNGTYYITLKISENSVIKPFFINR